MQYKWFAMETHDGKVYGKRNSRSTIGSRVSVLLHRFLMDTPEGMETDHISGDSLDNRRQNLRNATRLQNGRNLRKRKSNTSGVKGVYWNLKLQKWVSRISVSRKTIHLGVFTDLTEAGLAYDRAAVEHFGEFARTNAQLQS